ncbi:FXSXX-COOH protein [Streptomyces sp. NPDC005799]|uniref:FXSXX-COOH protein n=1 Tax=Streptomyces sp. NPDC005799 TaxID=3154678 RepID=UPI0033E14FD0
MTATPAERPAELERVPLVRLAVRPEASGVLLRVLPSVDDQRGPARVSVAAFQSSV